MGSTTHAGGRGNQCESRREPPKLKETVKVLTMEVLLPKATPWKNIKEKFLPIDFLLLTAKECELLSCLSFLDDTEGGSKRKLGPVHFGYNSSKIKIAVIQCLMDAAGPGCATVVVQGCSSNLKAQSGHLCGLLYQVGREES